MKDNLKEIIYKIALKNAVDHNGKASLKHVVSKIFSVYPDIKKEVDIKEIVSLAKNIVEEINKLTLSEQKKIIEEKYPDLLTEKEKEEKKGLDPLPGAEYGKLRVRFAPNPNGPLHIGHARAIVLNDEYAKMYKGTFILRLEDTDPRTKRPMPEAYEWIPQDIKWLGAKIHEFYVQSLRMNIYYEYAKKLIELGKAYVCLCDKDTIAKKRIKGEKCEHRDQPVEKNLELWDKMIEGYFKEGEAVLRVKTDLNHKNPSVRDWITFRIIENPNHPKVGNKYIVWPTYNFSCSVDDHLMAITHVIRMKEHIVNQEKQKYIFQHFGWEPPLYFEYGAIIVTDMPFHKSKIIEGLKKGLYKGWDDVNLPTLMALRRRGIRPEAIREYIISLGLNPVKVIINWSKIYKINRRLIDSQTPRYFFVESPKIVKFSVPVDMVVKVPKHPYNKKLGYKVYKIKKGDLIIYIDNSDFKELNKGDIFRLKDFANLKVKKKKENKLICTFYKDQSILPKIKKIQWVLDNSKVNCEIEGIGKVYKGYVEAYIINEKVEIVQFERKFFARIEEKNQEKVKGVYTHD